MIWGVQPLGTGIPDFLRGIVVILDQPFPLYRLFLIGLGSPPRSPSGSSSSARAGLLIRAVSQNSEMVHALGTDVDMVRTAVFGFGCALAALGGVLATPLVTAFLGMGTSVVIDAFVIVIIGGMGSFLGSIIGSVLVAFVQVMGAYYFQDLALAFMYLLMLCVLVVRPGGFVRRLRNWKFHFAITAAACACCRSWSRAFADHPGRGADLRPVRDEPRSLGGLLPAVFVRTRRRLRARRLFLRADPDARAAAAAGGHPAGGGGHDRDRGPIAWICTRSTGVSFAMLTLAFAQLGYAMLFRFRDVTGGSDGLVGIPALPGRSASTGSRASSATTIWCSAACSAPISCAARSCVRRSAPCSPASARTKPRPSRSATTPAPKIATVVLAYGFGGLAGALYAAFAGFASPELFFWLTSGRVLIMVVGGAGR